MNAVNLLRCPFCGVRGKLGYKSATFKHSPECFFYIGLGERPMAVHESEFERWNKRVFECEADEYGGLTILNRRFASQELCTVNGVYVYGERDELQAYSLSCGHEFQWDHVDPPAYCPVCGARVVKG